MTETDPPFPEVFVINLDHRTDRWAVIERTCSAADLAPVRVSAVSASPGWRGCALSHLKCVRLAKEGSLPWVLILEDDATFTPEAMDRFRGFLGYLWEHRDKWERFNGGPTFPAQPEIRILSRKPPLMYAKGFATHFNLIHARAYDIILSWDPERDRMIDVFYMELESRFRTVFSSVATVPHISTQVTSRSEISPFSEQSENDYSIYFNYSERKLRECLEAET
jgi:hypothetical protein